MWGWRHRPSGTEAIIALLLMIFIWFLALPVLGIAGLASENPDEKAKGTLYLIIFAVILIIGIFS